MKVKSAQNETLESKTRKILKERSVLLRKPILKEEKVKGEIEVVRFSLSNEKYGIESGFINEVIYIKDLTPLPCTPEFIKGIINVRGKILSVIDLKQFFGLKESGITNLNRVIIVRNQGVELGLIVDDIEGNIFIQDKDIQQNLTNITDVPNHYLKGVTKDRLIVFDLAKFLADEKIIIDEHVN